MDHNILEGPSTELYIALKNNALPPLHVAALCGLPYCTYYLLFTCHVNVNELCGKIPALILAIVAEHVTVVKLLLSHPDIQVTRRALRSIISPLDAAVLHTKEIVCLVLRHPRVDINETDNNGVTPFILACHRGIVDTVWVLLSEPYAGKLDNDQKSTQGKTASHAACEAGNSEIVSVLLEHDVFHFYEND